MSKGNTTFGFELAPRPNRFGFYPIVLRITRDRKKKRVNGLKALQAWEKIYIALYNPKKTPIESYRFA